MQQPQSYERRSTGAAKEEDSRALDDGAGRHSPAHTATAHQGSVEPFPRPDHKAKRHSRPHRWEDRQARRERQAMEWAL